MNFNSEIVYYPNFVDYRNSIFYDISVFLSKSNGGVIFVDLDKKMHFNGEYFQILQFHSDWQLEIENWLNSQKLASCTINNVSFKSFLHYFEIEILPNEKEFIFENYIVQI